jgi:hypothetical protein
MLRILVNSFFECGLGVTVAINGKLYQTHVFAGSEYMHLI